MKGLPVIPQGPHFKWGLLHPQRAERVTRERGGHLNKVPRQSWRNHDVSLWKDLCSAVSQTCFIVSHYSHLMLNLFLSMNRKRLLSYASASWSCPVFSWWYRSLLKRDTYVSKLQLKPTVLPRWLIWWSWGWARRSCNDASLPVHRDWNRKSEVGVIVSKKLWCGVPLSIEVASCSHALKFTFGWVADWIKVVPI